MPQTPARYEVFQHIGAEHSGATLHFGAHNTDRARPAVGGAVALLYDMGASPNGQEHLLQADSFETCIQAFLQAVGGKSYREANTGLGRSGLIINVNGSEYLVETKIYYYERLLNTLRPAPPTAH